jgi:tetratricopeptide (TPR) repeat protein
MNRFIIGFILISLFPLKMVAQDFNSLFEEGIRLERLPDEKKALMKFVEAQKINPKNLSALYKCSELCCRIGARESNYKIRDQYFQSALAYAKMAYKFFPEKDDACVSMSIALGRIALTKTGKEKVSMVKEIKTYADLALAINPKNFKAWHIIGKWNYEVSSLNFFERSAIKLFYGGLPESSFATSINAYEKANSINPYFCLNYLELAKAYYKNNNKPLAKSTLKYLLTVSNYTEDDPNIKKQAEAMLKTLN